MDNCPIQSNFEKSWEGERLPLLAPSPIPPGVHAAEYVYTYNSLLNMYIHITVRTVIQYTVIVL